MITDYDYWLLAVLQQRTLSIKGQDNTTCKALQKQHREIDCDDNDNECDESESGDSESGLIESLIEADDNAQWC